MDTDPGQRFADEPEEHTQVAIPKRKPYRATDPTNPWAFAFRLIQQFGIAFTFVIMVACGLAWYLVRQEDNHRADTLAFQAQLAKVVEKNTEAINAFTAAQKSTNRSLRDIENSLNNLERRR